MTTPRTILSAILSAVLAVTICGEVIAQSVGQRVRSADPRRETLLRMARDVSVELDDVRLQDIVQFVREFTGADIEAYWLSDRFTEGLDPDMEVSITVKDLPALLFVERVLEKVSEDFDPATWQLSSLGTFQIGPKSRLNRQKTLKVYDIQDLMFQIPDFADVPDLDIDSVLNQSQQGGGGGGGSIFEDTETQDDIFDQTDDDELAARIVDIITEFIEPDQWLDNGGDGGTIRYYNGTLLIRAPDYIHRQLSGYTFMPARISRAKRADAPRYASGATDTSTTRTTTPTPEAPATAEGTPTPPAQDGADGTEE